jgi:hypothetical protein
MTAPGLCFLKSRSNRQSWERPNEISAFDATTASSGTTYPRRTGSPGARATHRPLDANRRVELESPVSDLTFTNELVILTVSMALLCEAGLRRILDVS